MDLGLFTEYGLIGLVVGFVLLSATWILRRFLAKEGGILTEVGKRHIRFVDESAGIMAKNAETQGQLMQVQMTQTELTTKIYDEVHELAEKHSDLNAPFATIALHEAGLGFCDIMAKFASKLEVNIDSELRDIRRKLDTVRK
jgi:hypothetical protein